jgi:hypothetical protein
MVEIKNNPVNVLNEYEHHHLVEHFIEAGQVEQVFRLLGLETLDGKNAWYSAWDMRHDLDGYQRDVQAAWRLANQLMVEASHPLAAAWQMQCALITSSLASLSSTTPTELINILVDKGLWTSDQAISVVRRLPNNKQQAQEINKLIGFFLNSSRLAEALSAALAIRDEQEKSRTISRIAESLSPTLVKNAIRAVNRFENEENRAEALAGLCKKLPPEFEDEIFAWARQLSKLNERIWIYSGLARNASPAIARRLLELRFTTDVDFEKGVSFFSSAIGPTLSIRLAELGMLDEAFELVSVSQYEDNFRESVKEKILAKIPADRIIQAIRRGRLSGAAENTFWEYAFKSWAQAGEVQLALDTLNSMKYPSNQIPSFTTFCASLDTRVFIENRRLIKAACDEMTLKTGSAYFVFPFARRLLDAGFDKEGFALARKAIRKHTDKTKLALEYAESFSQGGHYQAAIALSRYFKKSQLDMLFSTLADHLPEEKLSALLGPIKMISGRTRSSEILARIALRLPEEEAYSVWKLALMKLDQFPKDFQASDLLFSMADHLPEDLLSILSTKTSFIFLENQRARLLLHIARRLPIDKAIPYIRKAQSFLDTNNEKEWLFEYLIDLGLKLPEDLLLEAAAVSESISSQLASQMPEPLVRKLIIRYQHPKNIQEGESLEKLMVRLAELGFSEEAFEIAKGVRTVFDFVKFVDQLFPYLDDDQIQFVLCAREIHDSEKNMGFYKSIAAELKQKTPGSPHTLDLLMSIPDAGLLGRAIYEAAPFLTQEETLAVFQTARVRMIPGIPRNLFAQLAAHLVELEQPDLAIAQIQSLQGPNGRIEALFSIIPLLKEPFRTQALSIVEKTLPEVSNPLGVPYFYDRYQFLKEDIGAFTNLDPRNGINKLSCLMDPERAEVTIKIAHRFAEMGHHDGILRAFQALPDTISKEQLEWILRPILKDPEGAVRLIQKASSDPDFTKLHILVQELIFHLSENQVQTAWRSCQAINPDYSPHTWVGNYLTSTRLDARTIAIFAPYLGENQLEEILNSTKGTESSIYRSSIQAAVANQFREPRRSEIIHSAVYPYELASDPREPHKHRRAFAPVLASLGMIKDALDCARSITSPDWRAEAAASVILCMPTEDQPAALRQFLTELQSEHRPADDLILDAKKHLIKPLAQNGMLKEALEIAWEDHGYQRNTTLEELAPTLAMVQEERSRLLWVETLPVLAAEERANFLKDLSSLQPWLGSLFPKESLEETLQILERACRWWP